MFSHESQPRADLILRPPECDGVQIICQLLHYTSLLKSHEAIDLYRLNKTNFMELRPS
jgi:hypothetical protein